ncbi:MAG: DUF4157 domain-containing protein [Myxococcota bacterium]
MPKHPKLSSAAADSLPRAVVQRRAGANATATSPGDVHAAAARGIASGGGPMPHGAAIQRAFGRHDLGEVRAHTGGGAAQANEAMGAEAYASGSHVAFRQTPDLHTAAHEAAHVIQQQKGVNVPGGVGAVGDEYERHADQVADAVVGGRSAEGLLDRTGGGGGGGAGVQRVVQHEKKGFARGSEMTEHKSGSQGAKEDFIQLMHGGDEWRAEKLKELLHERRESEVQIFYHLQALVMGENSGLEAAYATATQGGRLLTDIKAKVNVFQYDYLRHCVREGEPRFEDRVILALGLVTNTAPDKKEVVRLFESDDIDLADKLSAWNVLYTSYNNLLRSALGPKKYERLSTRLDRELHQETVANKGPVSDQEKAQDRAQGADLADLEVTALVKTFYKTVVSIPKPLRGIAKRRKISMLKRKKLGAALARWAEAQDTQARLYVCAPNSRLMTFLEAATKDLLGIPFDDTDLAYVKAIIANADPVGDEYFQDGKDTSTLSDEQQKTRNEEKHEVGAKMAELDARLDRKESQNRDSQPSKDFGYRWKSLVKTIDKFSEKERDWYLRSYLDSKEQALWDDPDGDHAEKLKLREKAQRLLDQKLVAIGMTGDESEAESTRKKIVKRFGYGVPEDKSDTFKRIKAVMKGDLPHEDGLFKGKKVFALSRKLRGDEFARLRHEKELMDQMAAELDPKYWGYIQLMLGIDSTRKDRTKGDVEVDVLGEQGDQGERKHDRDEARDIAEKEAELQPSHWGMMLTAALKHAKYLRRTEINSIVTRAYMAAKRRQAATRHKKDLELSGDHTLKPMSVGVFMARVKESMTPGALKKLEEHKSGKLKVAFEALENGTRPSVDDQIEDAKFRNPLKATSGAMAQQGNVERLFMDLEGVALLNEWSNIDDFRALTRQLEEAKGARNKAKEEEAQEAIRTFVIDIRSDRREDLKALLPTGQRVKVLTALREKLVSAMERDPAVIKALHTVGFQNDELSQMKTKSLGMLDKQKMRSTGAQYNTVLPFTDTLTYGKVGPSAFSAETKESTSLLLGRTRKSEYELEQGKDRGQVIEDNVEKIGQAQDELEKRGIKFDKLQKKYNRIVTWVVKGLVTALLASTIGVLTAGVGGVGAILIGLGTLAAKAIAMQAVKRALQGDRFDMTKAVFDVAFKLLIGAGTMGIGEFALPEVMVAVGEIAKENPGTLNDEAVTSALNFALGKGAKGIMRTAVGQLRDVGGNPDRRLLAFYDLGAIVATGGFAIAGEVYAEVDQAVQEEGVMHGDRSVGGKIVDTGVKGLSKTTNKVLAKGQKIVQKGSKPLRGIILKAMKNKHGEGRDTDLGGVIPAVLLEAGETIAGIEQQIDEARDQGESTKALRKRKREIEQLKADLETEYEAWQDEQREKGKREDGKDDEIDGATYGTVPLLMAALELEDKLHES